MNNMIIYLFNTNITLSVVIVCVSLLAVPRVSNVPVQFRCKSSLHKSRFLERNYSGAKKVYQFSPLRQELTYIRLKYSVRTAQ